MFFRRNYSTFLMALTFLLVMGHSMVPHWHMAVQQQATIASNQHVTLDGILDALIGFNLGEDHLEHFVPSDYPELPLFPDALPAGNHSLNLVEPDEEVRISHLAWPDPCPGQHLKLFLTSWSFRGPPSAFV